MNLAEKNFTQWCELFQHDPYQNVLAQGTQPESEVNRYLLSDQCSKLNVRFPHDFLTQLKDEDVVEIYDVTTYIQTWCSFNMFSYISYSPMEVAQTPFPELFDRPKHIFEEIFAAFNRSVKAERCIGYDLEPYILTEMKTKKRFLVENRYVAPLIDMETGRSSRYVICSIYPKRMDLKPISGNA